MRNRVLLCVSAVWVVGLGAALAQDTPGNVAQVFFVKPKADMRAQFEAGGKRHMEWHRQKKDNWAWPVWEVVAGEDTGSYIAATLGHHWKDFDDKAEFMAADDADYNTNIAPYVESVIGRFYVSLRGISRPPDGTRSSNFTEMIEFRVKVGAEADFLHVMRKAHEAIQKTNWPVRYIWYDLYVGGDHPTFVLILPREKWEDFKPLDPSFPAMLEKAFGRSEADSLMRMLTKSIESQRSQIMVIRRI